MTNAMLDKCHIFNLIVYAVSSVALPLSRSFGKSSSSVLNVNGSSASGLKAMFNPLSPNPTKWSNTLKQFVGSLANCLSVFDHFMGLALKGLKKPVI